MREERSISELHFMLSPALVYQKPKSGWVWPSSSLSNQNIFHSLKIPTLCKRNFCYMKKSFSNLQNFFSTPKVFHLPRNALTKQLKFCRGLKSFTGPKIFLPKRPLRLHAKTFRLPKIFWHLQESFNIFEESFSSTKIHQPHKSISGGKKNISPPKERL